ncbi:MAG: JDVT-CTERM system glutamic-type intramembrane protease [Magnetococcus sp. DMHC-6]
MSPLWDTLWRPATVWWRDLAFWLMFGGGVPFCLFLEYMRGSGLLPFSLSYGGGRGGWLFVPVVVYPILEEMVFRGLIQGAMRHSALGQRQFLGLTLANFMTTLLFSFAHMATRTPLVGLLVLIPSLIFGFFRDRFDHIGPGMILHIFYNMLCLGWIKNMG